MPRCNSVKRVSASLGSLGGQDGGLREYVKAVGYQYPPYTISPEPISRLRAVMPKQYGEEIA